MTRRGFSFWEKQMSKAMLPYEGRKNCFVIDCRRRAKWQVTTYKTLYCYIHSIGRKKERP